MLELTDALVAVGLRVKGVKTTYERLASDFTPAIVHLNASHFVVVADASNDSVSIFDGASGVRQMDAGEFKSKWSGHLLAIERAENVVPSGQALARWQTLLIDKGDVTQSQPELSYVYSFSNVGDKDLIVERITTDCTCVKYEIPKEPILPGKVGTVVLHYQRRENTGEFGHSGL